MRVGCDIIAISRIEKFILDMAKIFLDKFLSPKEQILIKNPATLAGLWAAKEAASKALGVEFANYAVFLILKYQKMKKRA